MKAQQAALHRAHRSRVASWHAPSECGQAFLRVAAKVGRWRTEAFGDRAFVTLWCGVRKCICHRIAVRPA